MNFFADLIRQLRIILSGVRFKNSTDYWIKRYESGGNSGCGSYDRLSEFKSGIINNFVVEQSALKTAEVVVRPQANIDPPPKTDLLIIAHPSFINGLDPLVAHRQAQGLGVHLVDVERIYDAYGTGIWEDATRIDATNNVENIDITIQTDTDHDGMADDWETFYFGDLSRDGDEDWDGDDLPSDLLGGS